MCGKLVDINSRVINAIKKYPVLYKNNASVEERKLNWQKLAAEVGLPAQFLMTRWHFLRERYQKLLQANNFDDFKYKSQMEFMRPYMRMKTIAKLADNTEIFKPEFIITEQDIVDDFNNMEQEEYTFLELDVAANTGEEHEQAVQIAEELEQQETDTLIIDNESVENELHIDAQSRTEPDVEHEQQSRPAELSANNNSSDKQLFEDLKPILNEASSELQANDAEKFDQTEEHNVKRNSKPLLEPQSTEQSAAKKRKLSETAQEVQETEQPERSRSSKIASEQVERCEDVIFVELVAAMFKTMPPERKRAVKKEIMNILL